MCLITHAEAEFPEHDHDLPSQYWIVTTSFELATQEVHDITHLCMLPLERLGHLLVAVRDRGWSSGIQVFGWVSGLPNYN